MSISYLCDGCGEPVKTPQERGFIRKRQYCKECVKPVDKWLKERDDLQEKMSLDWQEGLQGFRLEFVKAHPKSKLPDE